MATEVEIELRVICPEKVETFLKNQYGMDGPERIEEYRDMYFDEAGFRENGLRSRIRVVKSSHGERFCATKKNPKTDSAGVQSAEETESWFGDERQAYKYLDIGLDERPWFDETLVVKSYSFDGFGVDIREVKGRFTYVEIEGAREKIIAFSDKLKGALGGDCWREMPEGAFGHVLKMRYGSPIEKFN